MKKLLSILLLFSFHLAQSQTIPQGINYQAVALDQSGQPIPGIDIVGRPIDDAEIGVRIAILESSPVGTVLYEELHVVRTDLYGMFNLVIGMGTPISVDPFSSINWQGDKFLQVEVSIDNDGIYALSAVQQLMSVPYAFLAEKAMVAQTAVDVNDADADPSNELQSLSISGDSLTLSNGNTVQLPSINDADADPNNEIQVLSVSNDTLYLSNGGFAVLPTDQINDADADPSNEIQTLSKSGSTISLTNGGNVSVFDGDYSSLTNTPSIPTTTSDLTNDSGFLITEVDGSTTNELQLLLISNDTIYLTSGGYVVLPAGFDGTYSSLTGTPSLPTKTSDLTNDSGFLTSEVDGSTTNELQVLSLSNDTIYLTSGGYVILPAGFDGDYSSLSNTPAIPTKTSDLTNDSGFLTSEVDGSTTNELQVLSLSNDTIYLTSGGYVVLPVGFDGDYNSLTNTPSIPSKTSDLSNDSGFLISEVDGSLTNELQILSLSNDTIYLSDGGFVKLPAGFDGTYSSLTGTPSLPTKTSDLTNDSGFITAELDGSTTNELQLLSISNDTLYLTDGGAVKLPESIDNDSTNEIQTLTLMNNTLSISDGNTVTLPTTNSSSVSQLSQNFGSRTFTQMSDPSSSGLSYGDAIRYCINLTEGGHSDWSLATFSEVVDFLHRNPTILSSSGLSTFYYSEIIYQGGSSAIPYALAGGWSANSGSSFSMIRAVSGFTSDCRCFR